MKAKPLWWAGSDNTAVKLRELANIDDDLQPTVELIDRSLAQLQEAATPTAPLRRTGPFRSARVGTVGRPAWRKFSV